MRKHAKRKPIRIAKLTPTIFEVREAFNPLDRMIEALEAGEMSVATIDGKEQVYFTIDTGDQYPIIRAISGWISCWDRFTRVFGLTIDQNPLRVIVRKLESDVLLSIADVAAAKQCIEAQRQAYRKLDVYKIRDAANTEQIAIALEDVREAA